MRSTLAVLALLAACSQPAPAPPPAPPPIDEAAVNQAVTDVWNRIIAADTAENADAFVAGFHDDVRLDLQGMPAVIGKAAVDTLARQMFAARNYTSFAISPYATTAVSNDLALQGGSFAESFMEGKKAMHAYGRYAISVMRGADGQWRVAYTMMLVDSTVAAR